MFSPSWDINLILVCYICLDSAMFLVSMDYQITLVEHWDKIGIIFSFLKCILKKQESNVSTIYLFIYVQYPSFNIFFVYDQTWKYCKILLRQVLYKVSKICMTPWFLR